MPASMMSAPVGSSPNVIGSRIAMVAMGPTPGSTPMSVPMRQPTKQSRTLTGRGTTPMPGTSTGTRLRTVEKPSARLAKRSIRASTQRQDGDGKAEHHLEQHDAERSHRDGEDHRLLPAHLVGGEAADQHGDGARDGEARRADQQRENDHGA